MSRILFIAQELTVGGAAYLALRHLQRLATSRQVDLLVTGRVAPAVAAELPPGVTLHRLHVHRETIARGLLATREAMARMKHPCLTHAYDAIVGTSLFPDISACAAFSICHARKKVIVLLDEGPILADLSRETRAAMRNAILVADHTLPVSQGLLDTLTRAYPMLSEIPATVIPPPIDEFRGDKPSPFVRTPGEGLPRVVTVARLSPEKQLGKCLHVHRALRDSGVDFHWHVVGEGIERRALDREIAALAMADRFHLEGFQPDPRSWMRHADLFVLCSRSEGCPTVIREAIAEGTPVLSTDVNGARELVGDGITGMIVTDSEQAIGSAMRRLLAEPALRRQFRDNAVAGPPPVPANETRLLLDCLGSGRRALPAPLVTILIPTYDQSRFIGRAIHSALMQDYPALEVVVCDDASNDDTQAIVGGWGHDPRLRYVRRPVNTGRVSNYRRAVEHDAAGQWVLVLDGDDHLIDPSFVSGAMRLLADHAAAEPLFVQAGHRVVRQASTDVRSPEAPHVDILPDIPGESVVMAGGDYLTFVYETGFFTHLGTLYSRAAALRQGFYTSDISSADMDSLLRLALSGNVVVMKTIAGCWVQHGGNTSSNLPLERIEENVRIFRQIAREGAAAGVLDMQGIERCLTRYEARTLAHLFGTAIGTSAGRPMQALRMMGIMLRVNPRVCLEPELASAWWRSCKQSIKTSLKRLACMALPAVAQGRGGGP